MELLNLRQRPKSLTPRERFDESHVPDPNSGCWLWFGCENGSNGYGRITVNGVAIPAHRFSYEVFVGPIPPGMWVLHKCDNPACVNWRHLFVGDSRINTADKMKKGRQAKGKSLADAQRPHRRRGEAHWKSKLTQEQADKIREDQRAYREIAADYGVGMTAVQKIKAGINWSKAHG